MKKNVKKLISGAASAAMLVSQSLAYADSEAIETDAVETFDEVSNVQGVFSFDQDVIAPSDAVFSLFGTAATGVCAKPGFALDETVSDEHYYVNVSGSIHKEYTVSLADLKEKGGKTKTMVCSCATGVALAQTQITGVPVKDVLQLAEVTEDANAVAFKAADGYTAKLPLQYVLNKEAMLVWQVGDEAHPAGLQVWMPTTVAKYFTRQVTEIEVFHSDEEIVVDGAASEQRAKVSILNSMEEPCSVGDELIFSGYADDCGTPVTAVEFSMDGGKTWTSCPTEGADAEHWVAWKFAYRPENAGSFKLDVRAATADGTVSPLASSVRFVVK